MTQTITGEVIHVVGPEELAEADVVEELATMADSRHVLVCREGGTPSWFERVVAFLKRNPIQPITIVADDVVEEGVDMTATVRETDIPGVYDAIAIEDRQ